MTDAHCANLEKMTNDMIEKMIKTKKENKLQSFNQLGRMIMCISLTLV